MYVSPLYLAFLPQKDNGVVLQGVDAHRTGKRIPGEIPLRQVLGACQISEDAGFLFSPIIFVFSHARRSVQGHRARSGDFGGLIPLVIQQDGGVVLHAADQDGSADLRVGAGLPVLHREPHAVLAVHQGIGIHMDGAVHRIRHFSRRNDSILPQSGIGVVFVGNNAYGGAASKGGYLSRVGAAFIGAYYFVLDFPDAILDVFCLLVIGGICKSLLRDFGGVDGLLPALLLIPRFDFFFLLVGVRIVVIVCPRGILAASRDFIRHVAHRHFQAGDVVCRIDVHGARRNGTVDDYIGTRVIVGHAHVGNRVSRVSHGVRVDVDIALRVGFDRHLALRCGQGLRARWGVHRHFRLGVARQNRQARRDGSVIDVVSGGGKGGFRIRVGSNLNARRSRSGQVAVDNNVRRVVDA